MFLMQTPTSKASSLEKSKLFILYVLAFLFTLNTALPVYINSSFLTLYTGENLVGILYSISAILTIIVVIYIPLLLKRFGNFKTIWWVLILEVVTLVALSFSKNPYIIVGSFIINFITVALITLNMDIFIETFGTKKEVGTIRGTYLTSANIAWIIVPLVISFVLTDGDYWKIYVLSILMSLPIIFLLYSNLHDFRDRRYVYTPFWRTLKQIMRNRDVSSAFIFSFLLSFFYALMVIYSPIYLHDHVGFSWENIGIIFTVMLLPFILLELPLGKLADKKYGEREMLIIGFIVIAFSTMFISFSENSSIMYWAILLFITRVGASIIEIMSETYFFKKVNDAQVEYVSIFRTMRPAAYLVSPIIGSLLISFVGIQNIFLVLGLIMLYGVRVTLAIKDTN